MKKITAASIACAATLVAFGLGGCAQDKGDRSGKQTAKAQTIIQNATSLLNPTNPTKTAIEGAWVQEDCTNGSFDRGARSYNVGYVFIGNSFYKQIDYYAAEDCYWDQSVSLAEGRLYAEISAGWFSLATGSNGLTQINMLGAPNFGNRYELNVFSISGSGDGAILMMGDSRVLSGYRPTVANVRYIHWNTSSFAGR